MEMIPPLAIVQARIASTRLPGKMLLDLGGRPLVLWATQAACVAFGPTNVVAAVPASPENDELAGVFDGVCDVFRWDGPENDVLGRFHACAHRYRWHPDSVICRVTPDDPFKVPALMWDVAHGVRHPVEMSCEAFTLAMLDDAYYGRFGGHDREHLTHAIPCLADPSPAPEGVWTIDTQADLDEARRLVEQGADMLAAMAFGQGAEA